MQTLSYRWDRPSYSQLTLEESVYRVEILDTGMPLLPVNEPFANCNWGEAAPEEYNKLRPLIYPHTDVFFVFFSVSDPKSLSSVRERWIPEIRKHCPEAPFWLAATKIDLRDDAETNDRLAANRIAVVDRALGEAMAAELGAAQYGEISSLRLHNVKETVLAAVRYGASRKGIPTRGSRCAVM